MRLAFTKYQGAGNDFVVIDDRDRTFPHKDTALVTRLCDRRFGVGADGLMLVRDHEELDFRMIYYNSDGSQSLCGNGSRCAVSFAKTLGMIGERTTFETTDGVHGAFFRDGLVHFQLHDITEVVQKGQDFFVENGSPHHVQFVENIDKVDIVSLGRSIRHAPEYAPGGANVNFAELGEPLKVRTYERGVEQETLSCGTGVTAVAVAAAHRGYESPIQLHTKGGNLAVSFQRNQDRFTDVYLSGPATKVFEGLIEI